MSSLTDSQTETSFQEVGKPLGVGYVSTEGEKLLKALRKIQIKLHQKQQQKCVQKSAVSDFEANRMSAKDGQSHDGPSGDRRLPKNERFVSFNANHKTCEDNCNELIETRLKLIESQLQNISMQLMASNSVSHEMNGHKRSETAVPNHKPKASPEKSQPINGNIEDKYETTINAIKHLIESNEKMRSKSRSLEAISSRSATPLKHFHLNSKDIPFLLGTNISKSHSVIANRQIEIARLKQHSRLCTDQMPTTRKIFSQTVKTQVLDAEIKDLLYDLHEEHNYICEEIQHLSQQLETMTDESRRVEFNRELYFLSRRILAKKRQINELQELHSIVMRNAIKSSETIETIGKPFAKPKTYRSNAGNRCLSNEAIHKWL